MDKFKFEVLHNSNKSKARVCKIHTEHGIIDTPNFVAVGTNGTLKALDNKITQDLDQQLIFANTYHLLIQPGIDVIKKAGGLHDFINRQKPIITDSGGFQVFSLAYGGVCDEIKSKGAKKHSSSVIKISEDGVLFRSYKDGSKILLTPESSIDAQKKIGADIIVAFDELLPYHIEKTTLKKSLYRTHRWEKRSLDEHIKNKNNQALYAVIHGGTDKKLRELSCKYLANLPFDGFAIGGSVGKNRKELFELLDFVPRFLPEDKPNHLLGIGDLDSVGKCVSSGIDTFDSSHPTKCARHGLLFTKNGPLRIFKSGNKYRFERIEKDCTCYTCKNYTIAFLYHLFKSHEPVSLTLATIHNVAFMIKLMAEYRQKILNDEV